MANRIIVFSETRMAWIAPQFMPIRVLTGPLRKREGDEALIEIGTGLLEQKRRRVRVEKSKNGRRTFWWLVDMETA